MTKSEIVEKVRQALNMKKDYCRVVALQDASATVDIGEHLVTFAQLKNLAQTLGTENISLLGYSSCGDGGIEIEFELPPA